MTPKEKAADIWNKLFQKQIELTGSGDGNLCVELALIVVDEIIESVVIIDLTTAENTFNYWEEVKKEIEKL